MFKGFGKYFSKERYKTWFWLFWGVLAVMWVALLQRVNLSGMDKFLVYGLVMVSFICIAGQGIMFKRKDAARQRDGEKA